MSASQVPTDIIRQDAGGPALKIADLTVFEADQGSFGNVGELQLEQLAPAPS